MQYVVGNLFKFFGSIFQITYVYDDREMIRTRRLTYSDGEMTDRKNETYDLIYDELFKPFGKDINLMSNEFKARVMSDF